MLVWAIFFYNRQIILGFQVALQESLLAPTKVLGNQFQESAVLRNDDVFKNFIADFAALFSALSQGSLGEGAVI